VASVLLVGTGAVGVRAARQLVDTPGVERLLVVGRDKSRSAEIASALGPTAHAVEHRPGDPMPSDIAAVAAALPTGVDVPLARRAVAAGVPFASTVDDAAGIAELAMLDGDGRAAGVVVAAGCGLAPGLACVLARHAAGALDRIDEIHVARFGTAGRASAASLRRARREPVREWRDGRWHAERGDAELVWFPDPVGARECEPVTGGARLLLDAFPGVQRITFRVGEPPPRRFTFAFAQRGDAATWGSTRVEVWGWRGHTRESLVYGVIDRTAVAAGTVLALTAAHLAGALPAIAARGGTSGNAGGVHGLAALVEPAPFLAELARRGVKAAVFEGVAVA
jgi:hypothetical protein